MRVQYKQHFGGIREAPLVRITKKFIVVRWNDCATGKFHRDTGRAAPYSMVGSFIVPEVLASLNALADEHGGTYEHEKKRARK